jgi:hypothetical protein
MWVVEMNQDQFQSMMNLLVRIETRLAKLDRPAGSLGGGRGGFPLGRLSLPPTADAGVSALAEMPALSEMPVILQLPPLLDVLEDVQLEGADVLPEVQQSLAQIDVTLGSMQGAAGSIAPAPNKLPEVKSAMDSTSVDISSTLDQL